jgi:hypothetical protein
MDGVDLRDFPEKSGLPFALGYAQDVMRRRDGPVANPAPNGCRGLRQLAHNQALVMKAHPDRISGDLNLVIHNRHQSDLAEREPEYNADHRQRPARLNPEW